MKLLMQSKPNALHHTARPAAPPRAHRHWLTWQYPHVEHAVGMAAVPYLNCMYESGVAKVVRWQAPQPP